jgi:phage tail sheath protein FI
MAVTVTYPGVYIQELSSGVHTIVGVATAIGMFIGRTQQGEMLKPVRCLSLADFERNFSLDSTDSDLPRAVKLFFDNGGGDCYVVRIADGATPATVTMLDEAGQPSIQVTAKSAGVFGNDIRVAIDYNTPTPEGTFNLQVFRWAAGSGGVLQRTKLEFYTGLSMDPAHPRYFKDIVNLASSLITLDDVAATAPLANGTSISGFAISSRNNAIFQAQVAALLTATQNKFRLSVGGRPATLIDLSSVVAALPVASVAALETLLTNTINAQLQPGAKIKVVFLDGPAGPAGQDNATSRLLSIAGDVAAPGADVYIEPSSRDDLAGPMMLGSAQGGIEYFRFGVRRPAPNGVVFRTDFTASPNSYTNLGGIQQSAVNALRVAGVEIPLVAPNALQTSPGTVTSPRMYQSAAATNQNDGRDGIREKLALIATAINARRAADSTFKWAAEIWGHRLALVATGDVADLTTATLEAGFITPPYATVANVFGIAGQQPVQNTRYYVLGAPPPPPGAFYSGAVLGTPGTAPKPQHYEAAYAVVDREVDIFNLLVLPRDVGHTSALARSLWGPASNFCEQRRAFLLMDPPAEWTDHLLATNAAVGVNTLRVGLAKQYSALYFPNLLVREGEKEVVVGPSGAIAGLMARIDGTRGVWKAAAGIEADLRGIVGVQRRFSDAENGVMNPRAINTIRNFPNGIVSWGARTMDGDDGFGSEYKYSNIRRLANFIEESLYRGLKWAVFEPNDEPLWSQIRLNVGAFMHDLFRQGAFQGATARDAYFVRCDSTTTTQNDRNLGIVNVIVGFAPLKPAEFVILYLQQIAGQIQT